MFFHQDPLVFGVDRDSGIEFFGIASGERSFGMHLHSCEQRLRVRRLNACRLQLGGADLIVEQGHGDEIFQIVVGLLFGLGIVLRTIAPTSREIEGSLEDVATNALDICCHQAVAALQFEHRFQHRLAMNE